MYDGIRKIEDVIEYIEQNITSEINCDVLAGKMNLSVYEFRRIFSFIVGCPISEYIRKRRLSLAACEIMSGENINMLDLSVKYGYNSQSAFIKAFGEQHGISPTACQRGESAIHLFTRPQFQMNIKGRETVLLHILESEDFYIQGYRGISRITDTCCCEDVWNGFYEEGMDEKLQAMGRDKEIYVAYFDRDEDVDCVIGARVQSRQECSEDFAIAKVSGGRFACFQVNTVDDEVINEEYGKIIYEYIPSANLKVREDVPTIEIFPFDMSEEGFAWEIRIPIE